MKLERLTDSGYELHSIPAVLHITNMSDICVTSFLKILSFFIILSLIKVAYSKQCLA